MTSPAQSFGEKAFGEKAFGEKAFGEIAIGELVEPLVIAAGLELWDVEINPRAVRVLVDRPGGVDLEAVAQVAREVSAALDGHDDLTPGSRYELEVSSPGVERTLRTPSHFERFVGTVVSVKAAAPLEDASGSRRVQGVLLSADDAGITMEVDGRSLALIYDQIQKAHTALVWGPQAKPKGAKAASRAGSKLMKDAVT